MQARRAPQEEGEFRTLAKGAARGALGVGQSAIDVIPNAVNLAAALPQMLRSGSELPISNVAPGILSNDPKQWEYAKSVKPSHGELPFEPNDLLGAYINHLLRSSLDLENRGSNTLAAMGEIGGGAVAGGGLAAGAKTMLGRAVQNVALPIAGGGLGEAVGGTPGQVIGSVAASLTPAAAAGAARRMLRTPEQAERILANLSQIEAEGAVPSLGQAITGTRGARAVQGAEQTIAMSPGGTGPMADFASAQQQALADRKTAAVNRLGGVVEKDVVGEKVARTIEPYLASQSRIYENMNNQIAKAFGAGEQVPVSNYQKALDDLSTKKTNVQQSVEALLGSKVDELKGALASDAGLTPAKTVSTGILGASGAPITRTTPAVTEASLSFQGLKDLRSAIGQKLANPGIVSDIGTGELKKLYGALSQDMLSAAKAKGTGYGMLVERQNRFWSEHMGRVENFLNAAADKAYEPAKVISWAMAGAKDGPTRLTELRKAVDNPEIWRQVATTAAEDLGKSGGNWNSSTFVSNYNKLDPKARNVLFGVGGFQQDLERIVSAQTLLKAGGKAYANPSGSAPAGAREAILMHSAYATIGSAIGLLSGGPAGALVGAVASPMVTVAADNLLARKIFSDPAIARWLAQSTTIPASQIAVHLNRLSGLAQSSADPETRKTALQIRAVMEGIHE